VICYLPDEKENWDVEDSILREEELPDRKRKREQQEDEKPMEEGEEGKLPRWDPVHISQIKRELQAPIQKTEKLQAAGLGVSKMALEQLIEVRYFLANSCVVDLDWILIQWGPWIQTDPDSIIRIHKTVYKCMYGTLPIFPLLSQPLA
jgi:hypothetical protein